MSEFPHFREFGNAKELFFRPEAYDTESWFPDELIDKLFFIWDDDENQSNKETQD